MESRIEIRHVTERKGSCIRFCNIHEFPEVIEKLWKRRLKSTAYYQDREVGAVWKDDYNGWIYFYEKDL